MAKKSNAEMVTVIVSGPNDPGPRNNANGTRTPDDIFPEPQTGKFTTFRPKGNNDEEGNG